MTHKLKGKDLNVLILTCQTLLLDVAFPPSHIYRSNSTPPVQIANN